MKKVIFIFTACLMLAACGNTKWEYKVVSVPGTSSADFTPMVFGDETSMLNEMGEEGWELVDTYTETSTVFPNFGNEQYVTGLQPNTRTTVINFVFKRKPQMTSTNKNQE